MAILHAKQATTATIEQERRPKELRLLAMLIAIANTAVKRGSASRSGSPTHNIVTEEKATRWGWRKNSSYLREWRTNRVGGKAGHHE